MVPELKVTFVDELPRFPERKTQEGQCKYPFAELDCVGRGFDVHNRALSSVRQAMNKWLERNEGVEMSVRQISEKIVRVRRDK